MSDTADQRTRLTPIPRVAVVALALSLVIGLILLAFAWPTLTAKAQDIPVGIVGDATAVQQTTSSIAEHSDDALTFNTYDDRNAAVEAIEHRSSYGAIILPATQTEAPEVLVASAANPAVAQMLRGIATSMQAQIDNQIRTQVEEGVQKSQKEAAEHMQQALALAAAGQPVQPPSSEQAQPFTVPTVTVKVTDVVPLSSNDERGAGLVVAAFPMVLGGIIGGVLLSLTVRGAARRCVAVVLYSAAAGIVMAAILQSWFGVLQGSFGTNALALALAVAAITTVVTGLYGLFGRAGIPIGAVIMMFIGNPLSASSMPIEFMAKPWGAIGQLMPPGAASTLIRDLSYFPNADTSTCWAVLLVWTAVGLVLTAIAAVREHRASRRVFPEASAPAIA